MLVPWDALQLFKTIGVGASGVVWRGSYSGTAVAVKVLHETTLSASHALESLQKEVRCHDLLKWHICGLALLYSWEKRSFARPPMVHRAAHVLWLARHL